MPQVPVYNGPQARSAPLQPSYQSNVDVSSGSRALGQGLMQVGEVVDRAIVRDAETKANAADNEIAAGWLQWDAENRRKYQGENADGYALAAAEWWDKAQQTYGEKLDPMAKSLVGKNLARRRGVAMGSVAQYTEQVKEQHADNVAAANINTTIQFGVTTGDVAGAAERVRKLSAEVGARKGWKTEQVEAEVAKNLSSLHLAQISKLAEQDPAKAQAYYDANKAEVNFAQQPRVEEILRKEQDNQFATQFAAQQSGKPLSEQLQAAGEIKDPGRREKALLAIRNNYAMVEQAKREVEQRASDQAWQLVGQGKKVPEALLATMDGKERVQLQEHLAAKAKRLAEGGGAKPVKTDMVTYLDLRDRLLAGEKINLAAYTEKIGAEHMEKLLKVRDDAAKPGTVKHAGLLSDAQRVDIMLAQMGIDKKKDPESAARVMLEVDRRVLAASNGKELDDDKKQKIIDGVAMDKVFVDEFGSDPEKPLVLLTPAEMNKAYVKVDGQDVKVSSISSNERQRAIASIRSVGGVPTEQAIAEVTMIHRRQKAAPAVAPQAKKPTRPSIYASQEEWAAYRASQK